MKGELLAVHIFFIFGRIEEFGFAKERIGFF
jgi:hypothetical protein